MAVKDKKLALAEHLSRAILTLQMAPGSDVDEAALCERFELSRTPVREVFRDLDGLGYLEMRENRGTRVTDLSYTILRDFFLAAPMIYGAILRLAALNALPAQIEALQTAQEDFRAALRTGSTADRALANNRFHAVTGEMAGNVYLLPSFHRLLIDHARISMTFYRPQDDHMAGNVSAAAEQHDAIIAAIKARDADAASQLADDHWALSRNEIELFVMPAALDLPLGDPMQRSTA